MNLDGKNPPIVRDKADWEENPFNLKSSVKLQGLITSKKSYFWPG